MIMDPIVMMSDGSKGQRQAFRAKRTECHVKRVLCSWSANFEQVLDSPSKACVPILLNFTLLEQRGSHGSVPLAALPLLLL